MQVGLTSRIHRSLGLAFALLLLPVDAWARSAIVMLLTGALWAPQLARVLDATLRYTVDKTTREVLFLPLPPELKYRAKPFIDVTMDRFAKALAAVLLLVLIKPWGLGLDWRQSELRQPGDDGHLGRHRVRGMARIPAARSAPASARATIAPGTIRDRRGRHRRRSRRSSRSCRIPTNRAVLYAIEMLEALDKRHLVTPLLLQHRVAASPRANAAGAGALPLAHRPAAGCRPCRAWCRTKT